MAHHDYLEEEGGRQLVEFILQQCTLQSDNILVRIMSYAQDQPCRAGTYHVIHTGSTMQGNSVIPRVMLYSY